MRKKIKWCLYILECSNNALYTGITNDLAKRFETHKNGRGAKYTKWFPPVKVLYTEKYPDRSRAMKRELEVKSWPRKKKLALIARQ